jgi:DNA-binding NarL/FixJ family response regulator
MKVLIVEDSLPLRERLIHSIQNVPGVQVGGFADSAEEAISQINRVQPDVVVLDIRLRQGTGYEVLRAVKKPGEPPIVIVLTNFAYPQYRKKYMDGGAEFFFDKSNEFDQVVTVLEDLQKKTKAT